MSSSMLFNDAKGGELFSDSIGIVLNTCSMFFSLSILIHVTTKQNIISGKIEIFK